MNMKTGNVITVNPEQASRVIALCIKAQNLDREKFIPIPVVLIGGVGVGKSTVFADFVDRLNGGGNYKFWKNNCSLLQPEDLGGIPYVVEGELEYRMEARLPFDDPEAEGVLLFDELDRATPETQNGALTWLLDREAHGRKLGPGVYVCGAMNGTTDIHTTPLSAAARTRVMSIFLSDDAEGTMDSYETWAAANDISALTRGFSRFKPLTEDPKFEELAVDTRRTRDMAGRVLEAAEEVNFQTEDILLAAIAGLIGKASAVEFLAYREIYLKAPDPRDILADPETADLPDDMGIVFALANAVVDHVPEGDNKLAGAAMTYATRIRPEMAAFMIHKLIAKVPSVVTTKTYQSWAKENKDLLL